MGVARWGRGLAWAWPGAMSSCLCAGRGPSFGRSGVVYTSAWQLVTPPGNDDSGGRRVLAVAEHGDISAKGASTWALTLGRTSALIMAHTGQLTVLGLHVPICRTGTVMLKLYPRPPSSPPPPPGAHCANAVGTLTYSGPFLIHSVVPRACEMGR